MASTVVLSADIVKQDFHSGTVGGNYRFALTPGTSQDVATPEATFTGIADGDYTGTCKRLDDSNNPLGDEVSIVFSVPIVPNVQVDVPSVLHVAVS